MKQKIRNMIKFLNEEKKTTVILTTHDMGDVTELCKRIVIIDHGQLIYDNDIENLNKYFGAYRTLRVKFENEYDESKLKKNLVKVQEILKKQFENEELFTLKILDDWISILFQEDQVNLMSIVQCIQENMSISDMQIEEISTESVIQKIYQHKGDKRKDN